MLSDKTAINNLNLEIQTLSRLTKDESTSNQSSDTTVKICEYKNQKKEQNQNK